MKSYGSNKKGSSTSGWGSKKSGPGCPPPVKTKGYGGLKNDTDIRKQPK